MEESYNKDINEFVDWVEGEDLITGDDVTGGLPVSGGKIRKLLQDRMIAPVYLYENREKGKYQLFSSEESQKRYAAGLGNPKTDALLLGEFDGPAAYKIQGVLVTSKNLYLTSSQGTAPVKFKWNCVSSADSTIQPIYSSISIQIFHNGVKVWDFSDGVDAQDPSHLSPDPDYMYEYELDVFSHLKAGNNEIKVIVRSDDYSAQTSFEPIYTLIEYTLNEEEFNPFYPVNDKSIRIQPEYFISVEGASCRLYAFIDSHVVCNGQQIVSKQAVPITIPDEIFDDQEHRVHRLIMFMSTDLGREFRSNVICKQFVLAVTDATVQQSFLAAIFNFNNNSDTDIQNYKEGNYDISIQQYSKYILRWGLINYDATLSYSSVKFHVSESPSELVNSEIIQEIPDVAVNTESEVSLEYLPKTVYPTVDNPTLRYLGYTIGNGTDFKLISEIQSTPFIYQDYIMEAEYYVFKYDGFNKNNLSDREWLPKAGSAGVSVNGVTCTPHNIQWTPTNGWYEGSFRTQGIGNYLTLNLENSQHQNLINVGELRNAFTFEIDFMTEYPSSDDDILVDVGGFIKIYPNRAVLLDDNGSPIIQTNFKAGERVKVAFIKYPQVLGSSYSNLFLIVTNGIMERGVNGGPMVHTPTNQIKIGDSNSGIRVYGIRYYRTNLDWRDCYNNWIFDSDDKADVILRNMVFFTSGDMLYEIDESKCLGLMDTILVEGDLSRLIGIGRKEGMKVTSLTRKCPTDSTKNFTIENCWIRTHGQSNINYPVPSFKIWTNKEIEEGEGTITPTLIMEKTEQIYCKQRMQVYDGAVPANKWVLQSNFADSSCAHNGTFLRKWQQLNYSASFNVGGGKVEYKLRTPPQLFTSNQKITPLDGTGVENRIAQGMNEDGLQWGDYCQNSFPWTIRQAPNSFPALMFYRATENQPWTFLGQYVFMDDKKSDYEYGERSMYTGWKDDDGQDPFVMKRKNIPQSEKNPDGMRPPGSPKYDTKQYRVWDNKHVVRIEFLATDDPEVNFLRFPSGSAQSDYWTTWDTSREKRVANPWFELIYPDVDDIDDAEVNQKYGVWLDFCNWVISTNDPNLTEEQRQAKFEAEAAQHLDLYKLASYYIWCMMFGLVDSVNRNAQWKTYDGIHWSIEPWDMDVALGRQNNGNIAYDPPIDRQTPGASADVGAFSGKNSVLWNRLENWSTWIGSIVPTVAQALYEAGLQYEDIKDELDDYYSLRWPEYIYDKSGEYKYIYSGKPEAQGTPSFISWLQGSSITQRHWWLSTSMDYWFSKFGRGAFVNNCIKIGTNIPANQNTHIGIVPSQKSFFGWYMQQGSFPEPNTIIPGYDDNGLVNVDYYINAAFNTKVPFFICGLSSMQELDISQLGSGFQELNFVTDTDLTSLNLGATYSNGQLAFVNMPQAAASLLYLERAKNLQKINVTGQYVMNTFTIPVTLTHFYGAASSFLSGFAANGNAFEVLHLPNKHIDNRTGEPDKDLAVLYLNNCTWNELKFFNTSNSSTPIITPTGDDTERELYTGTIEEETQQLRIHQITFKGNTCNGSVNPDNGIHTRDLIFKWISGDYAQSIQDKVSALNLEKVWWEDVTLAQLYSLAPFYSIDTPNIKGRIKLAASEHVDATVLANIQRLFGDGVFSPGSAGLVVDYPNDIAVISVGSPAQYDDVNDKYLFDEADETQHGTEYSILSRISYVRFSLDRGLDNVHWRFYNKDAYDEWQPGGQVIGHPNVEIISQVNPDTEITTYYLKITESSTSITDDYEFGIGVAEDVNSMVVIKVTPIEHAFSIQFDPTASANSGLDTGTSPSTILFRSDQNCHASVNAVVGGNSRPPLVSWEVTGEASTYLTKVVAADGMSVELIPVSDSVNSTAKTGTLRCIAQYMSGAIEVRYSLRMLSDLVILDRTNINQQPLCDYFRNLLGIQDNVLYESDLAKVTAASLVSIASYDTAIPGVSIFEKLPNCATLSITRGASLTSTWFNRTTMPSLTSLTIDTVNGVDLSLPIPSGGSRFSLTTTNSNIGVIASGAIDLFLANPRLLSINNMSGMLKVGSTTNLTSLSIINDGNVTYSTDGINPSTIKWLSLIPAGLNQLNTLILDNVSATSVSSDHHELVNLENNQFPTAPATQTIGTIGAITVPGGFNVAWKDINPNIFQATSQSIAGKYYVLYNTNYISHATNTLHDAVTSWFAGTGRTRPSTVNNGNPTIGWTNIDLTGIANGTSGQSIVNLSNSGITSVDIDVLRTQGGTIESENLFNDYLTGYLTINLQGTIVNPNIQVKTTTLGNSIAINLGSPTSINIDASLRTNGCVLNVQDASGVTNVNLIGVQNVFSKVFGWSILPNLSGSINGTETATTSTKDTIADGLHEAINRIGHLTLAGTINSGGTEDSRIYVSQTTKDALQNAYAQLTLNIHVKMEAVDTRMQTAFNYLNIKSPANLNGYSWVTFWQAVYNAISGSASAKMTALREMTDNIVYAPESQYMIADPPENYSGTYNLPFIGVEVNSQMISFDNLRLLCYARAVFSPNSGVHIGDTISGCVCGFEYYPKLFKQRSSPAPAIDGVFIIKGNAQIMKYNEALSRNYLFICIGDYMAETYDGTDTVHNYVAYVTKQLNTQTGKVIPVSSSVSNWVNAIYKMLKTTDTSKNLAAWFGSYNPQSDSELPTV